MTVSAQPRRTLTVRDLVTIGTLAAIALVISVVIGFVCAMSIIGAFFYTAVAAFFVAVVFLLVAIKVRKFGAFLLVGTAVSLPGLMTGNVPGVAACIAGWLIADVIANRRRYGSRADIIIAYVVGSAIQFAGFTFPLFLSASEYLNARREVMHLSDEAIRDFLSYISWPVFFGATALTAILSAAGALIAARMIRKHFVKAGLVQAQ